jgi:hypothetical protein
MFISFLCMFRVTVPIIRRNNYVYATLGTYYFVWMTVWYAGWNEQDYTGMHGQQNIQFQSLYCEYVWST